MDDNDFTIERVHCCVCHGTGAISKMLFWKKPCPACDGSGKRKILIHKNITGYDRESVIMSASLGSINFVPPSLSEHLFGIRGLF